MFTEEKFQAFRSAMLFDDFEQLNNLFGPYEVLRVRKYLNPNMSPSEATIYEARAVLNAYGGDF